MAVLEQASIRNPKHKGVLGAYGRALADVGNYQQALEVLNRAHTPDQPDWHILSVQGAVLDQMGRHEEAQRYYGTALRIVPDEPSVLSNLGLSYALSKDLVRAETTLRRASAQARVDPRVRQNLALVMGLQGRFAEAENIAQADLPSDEAAANVAYLRQMLAQQNGWKATGQSVKPPVRPRAANSRASAQLTLMLASLRASLHVLSMTLIAAGPRITTNSTGRKNRIIGTVSFGGSAAAFFSASDMRMSRFSCAITRSVCAIGVP